MNLRDAGEEVALRQYKPEAVRILFREVDNIRPDPFGCWKHPKAWSGHYLRCWCGKKGRGRGNRSGEYVRAHQLVLQRKLGRALLPGMRALHSCDNKACVNPDHIYEGTIGDNNRDRAERGGWWDR